MKFNKILLRAASVVLSILIAITPVFGTSLETGTISHFGLPNVFDYDPYNISFITVVDGYIVVSQEEFLNAVVQGLMSNLAWEKYVNFTPYSVQHCEVNYKYYRCITAPRFDFTIDSSFGNYVSINGYSYSTGTQYTFPNSTSDLYFDRAITMQGQQNTANGHSTKTAYVYGIYTSPSIGLMLSDDSDNTMNNILDKLDSIKENVYAMTLDVDSQATLLRNIYTGVQTIHSDLSSVNSYLSSIDTNISSIVTTCDDILTQNQLTNNFLDDIQDYIEYHFPIIETDLYNIDRDINLFRSEFNNFALQCISHLNSIDSTTQSIDDSLDELLQLEKGTALESVPVTTSGGGTFSLWSVIKNSVTLGLNATGSFFTGLFDLLGLFGNYSSGFSEFTNVNAYAPISYIPEDLTVSNQSVLPIFDPRSSNNSIMSVDISNNHVHVVGKQSYPSQYTTLTPSFTLEPGQYLLYGTNTTNVSLVLLYNGTTWGSIVTTDNYPFYLNEQKSFQLRIYYYLNNSPFEANFDLKIVKTG